MKGENPTHLDPLNKAKSYWLLASCNGLTWLAFPPFITWERRQILYETHYSYIRQRQFLKCHALVILIFNQATYKIQLQCHNNHNAARNFTSSRPQNTQHVDFKSLYRNADSTAPDSVHTGLVSEFPWALYTPFATSKQMQLHELTGPTGNRSKQATAGVTTMHIAQLPVEIIHIVLHSVHSCTSNTPLTF